VALKEDPDSNANKQRITGNALQIEKMLEKLKKLYACDNNHSQILPLTREPTLNE
jgi:hypothetical protein